MLWLNEFTVIFPEVKAQEGGTEADTEMEIDSYASRDRIPGTRSPNFNQNITYHWFKQ